MKHIFLLLLILICLLGCERNWNPDPPHSTIYGIWIGKMTATYPGPDCGAIIVDDSIRIQFTDQQFFYYWINDVDTSMDGRGVYEIESNVTFTNIITPQTNPPLTINGLFHLRYVIPETGPDTMVLTQGGTPDLDSFFETLYFIELAKSDEIQE